MAGNIFKAWTCIHSCTVYSVHNMLFVYRDGGPGRRRAAGLPGVHQSLHAEAGDLTSYLFWGHTTLVTSLNDSYLSRRIINTL